MKWIYIIYIIVLGCNIPCPDKIKNCTVNHRKVDSVPFFFCDRKEMLNEFYRKRMFIAEWTDHENGCKYTYVKKVMDSIPWTKKAIDSINDIKNPGEVNK